jgi:YaiO family outer membrane protein
MFALIIVFSILLFSTPILVAQEIKWRNHRLEASYSYEYLDPPDAYGDWHNLNLALYTDISPTFTYFVKGTLFTRREGEGIAGTVGANITWTNLLYTYSALSAGSNSDYLYQFRADHDFNFKVGASKNYVFTAGGSYIYYSENRYDFIISGGATLYLEKWILHYRLFHNESNPGSVESYSHLISLGYGQEKRQWTHLNISFGKQAYLANSMIDPEKVINNSLNVAIKHRRWLGKHHGIFGEVSYFNLENEYDKYGITCGAFYEF